jgi:hypothetical protein
MPAVDYTLAKRSTLRRLANGLVSQVDVCDAHPELLRAAKYLGEEASEDCPVCAKAELRLVYYSFPIGKKLRRYGPGGRAHKAADLPELRAAPPTLTCYEVEVCMDCQWNFLRRGFDLVAKPRTTITERLEARKRRRI